MTGITRRNILLGAAALVPGVTAASSARAAEPRRIAIIRRTIEVKGRSASVFGLSVDGVLGPLHTRLGENFRFRLHNETEAEALIHWHGLTPPVAQDGVPMLSQPALPPGQAYDYDFPLTKAGTHWMHSHAGLQEQSMMAAPLIVHETAEPVFDEQEHVVMLHDFTFRDPAEILAELKSGKGAHAGHVQGAGGMDHSQMGQGSADDSAGGHMMGGAVMNDVVFDAYLANERTLDDPEIVTVEKGGWVKLRIINGAAASNMWIDLGEMEGELVAVDGHAVYPLKARAFPLAIAQRADIRLRIPPAGGAFPVYFHPEGVALRTGIVLATAGAATGKLDEQAAAPPALNLSTELKLRAIAELPDEPISRTEMLMLTGGGADYLWGFNGKSGMHDTLFTVREGDRVAVMMHNMTQMAHPMHLHGHYFQVTAIGNTQFGGAVRDTVLVPPMETVTIAFTADNPGTWAFHCHHIYHMNSGMMGAIAYTSAA